MIPRFGDYAVEERPGADLWGGRGIYDASMIIRFEKLGTEMRPIIPVEGIILGDGPGWDSGAVINEDAMEELMTALQPDAHWVATYELVTRQEAAMSLSARSEEEAEQNAEELGSDPEVRETLQWGPARRTVIFKEIRKA